jgi:hypothetical protein
MLNTTTASSTLPIAAGVPSHSIERWRTRVRATMSNAKVRLKLRNVAARPKPFVGIAEFNSPARNPPWQTALPLGPLHGPATPAYHGSDGVAARRSGLRGRPPRSPVGPRRTSEPTKGSAIYSSPIPYNARRDETVPCGRPRTQRPPIMVEPLMSRQLVSPRSHALFLMPRLSGVRRVLRTCVGRELANQRAFFRVDAQLF